MISPPRSARDAFLNRNFFWVYAAVAAGLLVGVVNGPWWHRDRDQGPLVPRAQNGTFTSWKTVRPSPEARMETQGAAVGGKLYLIGGYYETSPKYTGTTRCDVYDPVANTWKQVASMPWAVTHAGVADDGRYIYIAGGYPLRSDGWQNFASTSVYVYDTEKNVWSDGVSLPQPRGAGAMVYLGQELHFISGVDLTRADKTDHWVFNLADPKLGWVAAAPLPAPRNHVAAIALNGKIYVAGGQQGINDALPVSTLFIYNPETNKWTSGASMPKPRSHNSAAAFEYAGRFAVAGGETTNGVVLADVIAYDIPTNKWLALPSLPSPRHSPLVQSIGTTIVATDGAYPPTLEPTTWVSVGQ